MGTGSILAGSTDVPTRRHAVTGAPIRVLLVEDHRVLAESFAAVLKQDPALELVGIAATSGSAVALVESAKPDVVVMDVRLADGSGIEAATAIKAAHKETGVIFLTAYDNDETLWQAIAAGASAFLPKSEAAETVVEAIKRVAAGEVLLEPGKIHDALAWHRARRRYEQDRDAILRSITPREMEILRLLATGGTSSTIAARLHVSSATVKTHIRSLLAKLDVHSQLQAVAKAQAFELIAR